MKINVIVGATRPGNVTERVAKWVVNGVDGQDGLEAELVQLKDFDLPFLYEAGSPRYNPSRSLKDNEQAWLNKLAEADGYVIVSPEYNRTMPGVLKNAIDFIGHEIDHKPVAIVTHGSTGGALAAENIRAALRNFSIANVAEAVTLMGASELISEDGTLTEAATSGAFSPQALLGMMTDSLAWWTKTLKAGREQ